MNERSREGHSGTLRQRPAEDRPRERLLRSGGAALTDAEVIAVLLRTGRPGLSAVDLAREVLRASGGLAGLLNVGPEIRRDGLRDAKAASLLAAIELGRRLARANLPQGRLIDRPAAVARYLILRYGSRQQEVMGALYLDGRQRLVAERELFRGTLDRALVEPRRIFKEALVHDATGIVLFHNHPSGDPTPSAHDLAFTRRMLDAGELLGVALMDHLIIAAGGRWVSLRRRGAC